MYDERACGRGQAECDSATALNRGIFCRCGNGTEGQGRTEGLWKGCRDESHAATAPNRGICCRCGNGTEGQGRAEDLWKGCCDESHAATALNRGICCRCGNGTEGQGRTEGLWKGCRDESHGATAPNCGICCRCGNGTEGKRDEGAMGRKDNAVQKACGKDAAMKVMPQRHRIAEFAAVVETGRRGNAVQKACRKDAAMKAMPQRHRIAEFAAVVETGRKTFIIFTDKTQKNDEKTSFARISHYRSHRLRTESERKGIHSGEGIPCGGDP